LRKCRVTLRPDHRLKALSGEPLCKQRRVQRDCRLRHELLERVGHTPLDGLEPERARELNRERGGGRVQLVPIFR
jgi:hypothetical protein